MSEYTEQAERFMSENGLEFRAVFVGRDCPMFCADREREESGKCIQKRGERFCVLSAGHDGKHKVMGLPYYKYETEGEWYYWECGEETPATFPRRTHIHGAHYRCTISRKGRGHISIDFWNSYRDEEINAGFYSVMGKIRPIEFYERGRPAFKKRTVEAYDVLACIQKSYPGSFSDFCADFGYDEDSRKVEQVYQAVLKEWQKVRGFFTDSELEALQEIA